MVSRSDARERLSSAAWLRLPETQQVFSLLDGAIGRTRAVGGVVRDTILGLRRTSHEIDFATELTPAEVTARAQAVGLTAHPTGIEHGTVTVRVDGLVAEITTLREDIETDGRRAVVRYGTDWRRDAERRDFTMNALYCGPEGDLHDPIGGLDDAAAGRVRFIGDPDQRIAEDRLRVYRFFRFSASLGGEHFDPAGLAACRRSADRLGRLSAERVGAEMRRMLALPRVALTLQTMSLAGIVPIPADAQRALTSYELRAQPPTVAGRLALFMACSDEKTLKTRWRLSNAEVAAASAILEAAALLSEERINEAAYRHPAALDDALAIAAVTGHWPPERVGALRGIIDSLSVPRFPVSGHDLAGLGMEPGAAMGAALRTLETDWIDSGFTLDRDTLLGRVRR